MKIAAYVYPGWHPATERDRHFPDGWTEWDLVLASRPRFEAHVQPRVPLLGTYDDSDPREVGRRVGLARRYGVDVFVYGFFWCRGKRIFQEALDQGYLGSPEGAETPFAVMWANRMPRHVLPVKRTDTPVIEADRRVDSDVEDFVLLVRTLADRYFGLPNYLHVGGRPYFSIYDSTFFVREMGPARARLAVDAARAWLRQNGLPGLHLAAVDPAPRYLPLMKEAGFDSVTHYVFLPYWKGDFLQDYGATALRRAAEWEAIPVQAGLPYHPSVSPGWDASPRGADFGAEKPRKYPWWPVVVGEHPRLFQEALSRALEFADRSGLEEPLVFLASLNEWSEGHYIEPDTRFGHGWLEAVRDAARARPRRRGAPR